MKDCQYARDHYKISSDFINDKMHEIHDNINDLDPIKDKLNSFNLFEEIIIIIKKKVLVLVLVMKMKKWLKILMIIIIS